MNRLKDWRGFRWLDRLLAHLIPPVRVLDEPLRRRVPAPPQVFYLMLGGMIATLVQLTIAHWLRQNLLDIFNNESFWCAISWGLGIFLILSALVGPQTDGEGPDPALSEDEGPGVEPETGTSQEGVVPWVPKWLWWLQKPMLWVNKLSPFPSLDRMHLNLAREIFEPAVNIRGLRELFRAGIAFVLLSLALYGFLGKGTAPYVYTTGFVVFAIFMVCHQRLASIEAEVNETGLAIRRNESRSFD